MDTALPQKYPFILDSNLAKANCTEYRRVCMHVLWYSSSWVELITQRNIEQINALTIYIMHWYILYSSYLIVHILVIYSYLYIWIFVY